MAVKNKKITIGWKEWCALPNLELPAIKAKIDTGATTSSLHAFNIKICEIGGKKMVQFSIHPVQHRKDVIKHCIAPLVGKRMVSNSTGQKQLRYTIKTQVIMGEVIKNVNITLTNRGKMSCRMLIGREALRPDFLVDSHKTFLLGKMSPQTINNYYDC